MATCSSILAWKIPQTEEPGKLQSMGPQRVRHVGACACTHTNTGLNTLLNRSGERVSLSYCRFWWEGFQLLTVEYYVDCGFVVNSFYYVETCSFYTHFGKSFSHEWMLNLSNAFSTSIVMIKWLLSFLLLMWCITLINLCMLNHPCDPGMNPAWSRYLIFFMYCWIWCWLIFC